MKSMMNILFARIRRYSGRAQFRLIPSPKQADLIALVESAVYRERLDFFGTTEPWKNGLTNGGALALMELLIGATRPQNVVEIGSNRGWTAHAMAQAMEENPTGLVHTIGPFDSWRFMPVYESWPSAIRQKVKFYPINSAAFFQDAIAKDQRFELIFVDGNHDYEFALFDIQCAARVVTSGGHIVIDNVDLPDVRRATDDFLSSHLNWTDCRDARRTDILNGSIIAVLVAP